MKDAIAGGDYSCMRPESPYVSNSSGDKNNPRLKDVHVAANLIKIYLRSLSEPLIPYPLYNDALAAGANNNASKVSILVLRCNVCARYFHKVCIIMLTTMHL